MASQILWISCILISVFYIFHKLEKISIIKKYKDVDVITLFEYFLNKAYDTIYENDLITYITNNTQPLSSERETLERNYIKSCLLYMGKRNVKLFTEFFGDNETLVINIIRYMRKKFNEDGLVKIINEKQSEQTNT